MSKQTRYPYRSFDLNPAPDPVHHCWEILGFEFTNKLVKIETFTAVTGTWDVSHISCLQKVAIFIQVMYLLQLVYRCHMWRRFSSFWRCFSGAHECDLDITGRYWPNNPSHRGWHIVDDRTTSRNYFLSIIIHVLKSSFLFHCHTKTIWWIFMKFSVDIDMDLCHTYKYNITMDINQCCFYGNIFAIFC